MAQTIILVISSILATVGAHLCFKQGVVKLGEISFSFSRIFSLIWQVISSAWLLSGMVLFGFSFLLWVVIISKVQLNIIYPIVIGLEVSLVAIGSWLIFKEFLNVWQVIGIVVILLGIFLIMKP